MNLDQIQIENKVLTTIAQGYIKPATVAEKLFPLADGPRSGKIIKFGKEAFMLYNTEMGPRSKANRIDVGYTAGDYHLGKDGLETAVSADEEKEAKEAGHKINLHTQRTEAILGALETKFEKRAADIAQNAANYETDNKQTLSGTDQFSDYTNSKPVTVIGDANATVRGKIGIRCNTLLMGAVIYEVLKEHPAILDKIKYTQRGMANEADLASIFRIEEVMVGESMCVDAAGNFIDLWGNTIILAYIPKTKRGTAQQGQPSYGYTYQWQGYPKVFDYVDAGVPAVVHVAHHYKRAIHTGMGAGFLISNVVALP